MKRRLAGLLAGTGVYLVMLGRVDGWSLLQGLAITAGALAVGRWGPRRPPVGEGRLLRGLPILVWRVLTGAWKVGLVAAGLRSLPRPRRVEIPIGDEPGVHPGALAILETLSPGTYLMDVDDKRGVLLFHVFDQADAEELERRHARLLGTEGADAGNEDGGGRKR